MSAPSVSSPRFISNRVSITTSSKPAIKSFETSNASDEIIQTIKTLGDPLDTITIDGLLTET